MCAHMLAYITCICSNYYQLRGHPYLLPNTKTSNFPHFGFMPTQFHRKEVIGYGVWGPCKGHFTYKTESPWPLHFKHPHWWERRSQSKFASHYAWGTNGVCECKMDVKSTWVLMWHQLDHVSMVTWTIFKNHFLEVGLTQNQNTIAFWTLTSIGTFYLIMCEDPRE